MSKHKISDEMFKTIVSKSVSIRNALSKLKLKPAGGNYKSFKARVKKLNISIEHFSGQAHNRGKKLPKRNIHDYLNNQASISSHKLRLRLINEGIFPHKCFGCQGEMWLNNPMPLELDHIDGNSENNSIENLRLLCPNCHSFTITYRGRKKKLS